jgi:hypothetical protein
VPIEALARLPGVTHADRHGEVVLLNCSDSDRAIRALLAAYPDARDLEISGAGLYHVARALPSYWLVQASHVAVGGQGWGATGWAVVGGWSVVLGVLAGRAYRRDTARV